MARVNVGVNPALLTDQWLVAESVEITMITGSLRANGNQIKGAVPAEFKLGAGHINFFKNKLQYLTSRLVAVNEEMTRRGFSPGTSPTDLQGFPEHLYNVWAPTNKDSFILRQRLLSKLYAKPNQWRYHREYITDLQEFSENLSASPLYYV